MCAHYRDLQFRLFKEANHASRIFCLNGDTKDEKNTVKSAATASSKNDINKDKSKGGGLEKDEEGPDPIAAGSIVQDTEADLHHVIDYLYPPTLPLEALAPKLVVLLQPDLGLPPLPGWA